MLYKRIFCLFLCSTILSPIYGMEPVSLDESNRSDHTAPKSPIRNVAKFPVELTYGELCQIFALYNSKFDQPPNSLKVETTEGFLVSHKATSVQAVKIKGFLLRAKELQVVAVGELDHTMGESYTMGVGYQGLFAKYQLYKGDDLVPNYDFSASISRENTVAISPQPTPKTSTSFSAKKSSASKKNTPRGFEQENNYLDFVVDLLLDIKMPDNFKPTPSERAELLVYSYPAFTTEKNLFSLLNIFKKEYPEEKHLENIMWFLQILKGRGLPNGQKNLKKAENEFDELTKILDTENLQENTPEFKYIVKFNEQIQKLKTSILESPIKEITNDKEHHKILTLIRSRKCSPIDGMNLNNLKFMNELFRRDVALSRLTLSGFSRPESELWETISDQANETSRWVALQYLSLSKKEDRENLYNKFNVLFNSFIKSGNFHGAWQIAMGFQQTASSRAIDIDKKLKKDAASDVMQKEKVLSEMESFTNASKNHKSYHDKEYDYLSSGLNKSFSYLPSLFIINHDIILNSEFCSKELLIDSKNPESAKRRLFLIQETAKLLETASSTQISYYDSDDTYLKAVCSFKIHPETLEVYSDLLYPWPAARNEWASFEPKTLDDWTPGYFAHLLRKNGCEHAIEICFKNKICDGKDIIHRSKMKKEKLIELGGIRGLSEEMINCIMSAPRKTEEKSNHPRSRIIGEKSNRIRSNSRKTEEQSGYKVGKNKAKAEML